MLDEAAGPGAAAPAPAEIAAVRGAAARVGGGLLADAVRADGAAAASRLIARCAWVPALADALAIAGKLPPGWSVATRSGAVVTAAGSVRLGIADAPLERRAEAEAVRRDLEAAEAERVDADGRLARAHAAAEAARAADAEARAAEGDAASRVRSTEEAERRATRDAEQAAREAGWAASRLAVIAAERVALADRLGALTRRMAPPVPPRRPRSTARPRPTACRWMPKVPGRRGRRARLTCASGATGWLPIERSWTPGAGPPRVGAPGPKRLPCSPRSGSPGQTPRPAALAVRDEALVARGASRERQLAEASAREEAARGVLDRCLAADRSGPRAAPAGRDGSRRGS